MLKKGFLASLLLFGMFFGSGNLIFPPQVGVQSGGDFVPAIAGFLVSGVGIAMLSLVVGAINPRGYAYEIESRFGKGLAVVILVAVLLTIGPFFAIPRTASLSYSIGVESLVPKEQTQLWLALFTLGYFVLAGWLSLNTSKLLGRVGKVLTPIFAGLILLLIIVGVARFGGSGVPNPVAKNYAAGAFGAGLLDGYNTMDALASVVFSVVAVATLRQLKFKTRKEYVGSVWIGTAFVALFMTVLYVGLALLGNHFAVSPTFKGKPGVYVLTYVTQELFGGVGQVFLAVMVTLTCFTTTVGLIVSVAEYFVKLFPKFSYKQYVLAFTVIGFGFANFGLDQIITYSVPVLLLLYPIIITLMMMIVLNRFMPLSKIGMWLTLAVVTAIAIPAAIADGFGNKELAGFMSLFPLGAQSMPWLIPALVGLVLSLVLPRKHRVEDADKQFAEFVAADNLLA